MHWISSSNNFKIFAAYARGGALLIGLQVILLDRLNFPLIVTLTDALVTQTILLLSGYVINVTMRFYRPRKIFDYAAGWSVALAGVSTFLQWFILKNLLANHSGYISFLQKTLSPRAVLDFAIITVTTLLTWLWFNTLEQKENEKQKENTDRLLREAELSNLRMQLQPHFLFNSLNSISALIGSSPELARTMIQQLSDFLRATVRKDDRQLVALEEEINHLLLYLEIEKIRFGHRLGTTLQIDEACLPLKIPSLLLQPIVENAIKFGLYDTIGEITISLSAKIKNQQLVVEITNPFDPSTSTPRKGTGFGLDSIRRRLYLIYTQNDLLETTQHGDLFSTRIKIPQLS
jgi:two-component system LytT family sensor kinase